MKKISLVSFAILAALAISPAVLQAQNWDFTLSYGSVSATGTFTSTFVSPGVYDITGGTISVTGSPDFNGNGVWISPINNFKTGGGTNLSGILPADSLLYQYANPQLDSEGVLEFTGLGAPGYNGGLLVYAVGAGNYGFFGGVVTNGLNGGASFSAIMVPEGGTSLLYLLLTGVACFGAIIFGSRKGLGSRASA